MASSHWFVGRDGKQLGPYRYDTLRRAASDGKLRADDLVWTEGMPAWSRADSIVDLLPLFQKPVATASPEENAPAPPFGPKPYSESALTDEVEGTNANYLVRHWRGDYSLARSYWVNSFLVGILLYLLMTAIGASGATQNLGLRASGWFALAITLFSVSISLWSAVGVWNSAEKHVARGGRSGWATLVKVLIFCGLLRLAVTVMEQAPVLQQAFSLASGNDTMKASQLRVVNHATEVEISGGLSYGTADSLKVILDATPSIRVIQLNNVGGWVDEGAKLGRIVEERHLATYTARECDSACLLVFLAGSDRYLGKGGKLGFHQASVAGLTSDGIADGGMQVIRDAMEAKGAPSNFIEHALSTPPSEMWYPTTKELLDAHIVTAVALCANVTWNNCLRQFSV